MSKSKCAENNLQFPVFRDQFLCFDQTRRLMPQAAAGSLDSLGNLTIIGGLSTRHGSVLGDGRPLLDLSRSSH